MVEWTQEPSKDAVQRERAVDVEWFRRELQQQRQFRLNQLIGLSYEADKRCPALAEVRATLTAGARCALAEIDAALFRLARGSFGRCELCGRMIPLPRLEALPTSRLCLACEYGARTGNGSI